MGWAPIGVPSRHMFDSIFFPTRIDKCLRLGRDVLHPLCARRLPRRRRIPGDIFWHLEHDRNRHELELPVVCLGTRKWEWLLGLWFGDLGVVVGRGYVARRSGRAADRG